MSTTPAPRPFLLTLLGVLGVIQGFLTVIAGIALMVEHDDLDLLRHVDVSSDTLLATGIAAVIVGVITLMVAFGLLSGSSGARLFLAIIEVLHIGGGLYVLIVHSGTQRWDAIGTIVVAL
ncbi:MAG: hypothetical protein AB7O53_12675, partial [Thermoleophilia bacterium]